jgi:DHA2 family multidrug resistance protein
MAISLGAMQYVLEEGNKKDWLDDGHILLLTIIVVITFIWLIIREVTYQNPIIDLGSFKNKNFSFGCIYSFILGIGLYGTVYLLPLFLFTIAGYNTLQIGITMIITGVFQFVSAPMAAKMFGSGMDKRIILAIGFSLFSIGSFANSFLTAESQYWELFIPQMIRGLSLMFCFMPINDLALGTMKKDEVQNASGLYNLTRNLGGAIGLAMINNLIISKSKIYAQTMKDNMPLTSPKVQESLEFFTQSLTGKVNDPETAAYLLLSNMVEREAFVIAINNVFVIIAMIFCMGMILIPFSSTPETNVTSNAH